MKEYRLAMIGFGNVGQGFVQLLQEKREELNTKYQCDFKLVAVVDMNKGFAYEKDGLDYSSLLRIAKEDGRLDNLNSIDDIWDVESVISKSQADIIVEVSYTNLETGLPAIKYVEQALSQGKHVITSNKGPIAVDYVRLNQLAKENNCQLGVEGTVMSGTPALSLANNDLSAAGITNIAGILNGTTNYILSQMESGSSYQEALSEAQALGFAEADPTGDVEGFDAAGKVVILANLLLHQALTMKDVQREGITQLSVEDIQLAKQKNKKWKLIGSLERKSDGSILASVKPKEISVDHPLASVNGATNAITITTEILGDVTLVGPGAGRLETGYALLLDILSIVKKGLPK